MSSAVNVVGELSFAKVGAAALTVSTVNSLKRLRHCMATTSCCSRHALLSARLAASKASPWECGIASTIPSLTAAAQCRA
jgi:hypothetical protein